MQSKTSPIQFEQIELFLKAPVLKLCNESSLTVAFAFPQINQYIEVKKTRFFLFRSRFSISLFAFLVTNVSYGTTIVIS